MRAAWLEFSGEDNSRRQPRWTPLGSDKLDFTSKGEEVKLPADQLAAVDKYKE